MNELLIDYGTAKSKRMTYIVIGAYLALFCLYFCITEGVAGQFSVLFFCALVGIVLASILVLGNSLWLQAPVLKIDNEFIASNPSGQKGITVSWTSVSRVNIGVSYIVFNVNGGTKQQKIDLSSIYYSDIKEAKAKIIEICEYKNIPYLND